eukprot:GILK01003896.1.p1 GENE.GILK01003896.1~~GILK01003896.1.p1  ORF type:complete len:631 (-),score=131.05 GILK01003896.1:2114-3955(-)
MEDEVAVADSSCDQVDQSETVDVGQDNSSDATMKLCVLGLDKWMDAKDFEKWLKSFEVPLEFVSAHKNRYKEFGFVCFSNEESKSKFEAAVDNSQLKGRKIRVRPANEKDAADRKRPREDKVSSSKNADGKQSTRKESNKKQKKEEFSDDLIRNHKNRQITTDMNLQDIVTPLWQMPYEEQLQHKETYIRNTLAKVNRALGAGGGYPESDSEPRSEVISEFPDWSLGQFCCSLESILPSPEHARVGYRNKCEFTIGWDRNGQITVGFNRGGISSTDSAVESPNGCINIPPTALAICSEVEALVKRSELSPYHKARHDGSWRTVTVRLSNKTKQALVIVQVAPQAVPEEKLSQIKSELVQLLVGSVPEGAMAGDKQFSGISVISLYMQIHSGISEVASADAPMLLLSGQPFFTEQILGFSFQISPDAFFQVNSETCEVLYSKVRDWAEVDQDTVVLDICCGTGTIAICVSSGAFKVAGIEMVESAVQDAKHNAELNHVTNCQFYCGKAESVLSQVIDEINRDTTKPKKKIVGIVDPPRAGLHPTVLKALRTCKGLNRLVYVSCNPDTMVDNVAHLCRPANKKVKGPPFTPVKAVAVDLFPHTVHCEAVMLLQRL